MTKTIGRSLGPHQAVPLRFAQVGLAYASYSSGDKGPEL
jgi:hypothetical protein